MINLMNEIHSQDRIDENGHLVDSHQRMRPNREGGYGMHFDSPSLFQKDLKSSFIDLVWKVERAMANAMGFEHHARVNDVQFWEADRITGYPPPMLAKPLASIDALYESVGCRGAWYRQPGGHKHIGDSTEGRIANQERRQQHQARRGDRDESRGKGNRRTAKGDGRGKGRRHQSPSNIPMQQRTYADTRAENIIYRAGGAVETEAASSGYRRSDRATGSFYSGARPGDTRPQDHPSTQRYQRERYGSSSSARRD